MEQNKPNISIKALSRQNAMTLTVSGVAGMALCAVAAGFWWHDYRLNIVFLFLVSFVTMALGLFKHFEPPNSFELTPDLMVYCHRYGNLPVSWDNMMIIDQPRVTEGAESKELAYIGFKLKDADVLAKSISRRMANHLLQEQRDLYFLACQLENISLFERQINDKPYKTAQGEQIIGPIGAWLHRMVMLRRVFGYDLMIPLNACDREPQAFIDLLKQCKASSADYHD